MNLHEEAARDALMARLAQSRAEIQMLLDPPPGEDAADAPFVPPGEFPRSRTMRMLMSGRGLSTVGALAGGLLLARPGLIWRLVRSIPTRALTRMIVVRALAALRERHSS
jgi:hypothetical protein